MLFRMEQTMTGNWSERLRATRRKRMSYREVSRFVLFCFPADSYCLKPSEGMGKGGIEKSTPIKRSANGNVDHKAPKMPWDKSATLLMD